MRIVAPRINPCIEAQLAEMQASLKIEIVDSYSIQQNQRFSARFKNNGKDKSWLRKESKRPFITSSLPVMIGEDARN